MSKLKSRKLWMAIASVLGSIATAIAGFACDNEIVTIVGVVCGVVSAAIYEIVEAVCDVEEIESKEEG